MRKSKQFPWDSLLIVSSNLDTDPFFLQVLKNLFCFKTYYNGMLGHNKYESLS